MADARLLAAATAALTILLLAGPAGPASAPSGRRALVLGGVALSAVAAWVVMVRGVPIVWVVVAVAVSAAAAKDLRRRRSRRAAEERRDAAIEACAALVAGLRAGLPTVRALGAAAEDWPELRPVADAARLDADVPAALLHLADRPGGAGLRWVAAAWVVSHRSGAGLATAVDLAVSSMTESRTTARVLETELASARATARLLAVLPFGVLLIGAGAGGDPIGFLVGTLPGAVCLFCGLGLAWVGSWWIERLAAGIDP